MNDALKRLAPLIQRVSLRDIKLAEASCRGLGRDLGGAGELDVRFNWSARAVLRAAGEFSVFAEIEALLVPTGKADADGARIWGRFELQYVVPQDTELSEGLLEEFAKSNGVFNAWSYWREFIQSTLVRMGLPPLALPVYLYRPPVDDAKPAPAKSDQ